MGFFGGGGRGSSFAFHFLSALQWLRLEAMLWGSSCVFRRGGWLYAGRAGRPCLSHSRRAGAARAPQTIQRLYFIRVIHYQTAALPETSPVPPVLPSRQQNRFCFPWRKAELRYVPSSREERIFLSHLYSLWESGPRAMSYCGSLSGKGTTWCLFLAQAPSHSPNPK